MKKVIHIASMVSALVLLAACASAPQPVDKRVAEQKQGADKAQRELSRSIERSTD